MELFRGNLITSSNSSGVSVMAGIVSPQLASGKGEIKQLPCFRCLISIWSL